MESFAKRFKHLRENTRLTQDEVAEKLGVSRSTIAGYESEEKGRTPRKEVLKKASDLFGVRVEYLLLGEEEQPKIKLTETEQKLFQGGHIIELTDVIKERLTVNGKPLTEKEKMLFLNIVRSIVSANQKG